MSADEERTDEDRIIEAIVIEGKHALYEDIDFLPLRQSLYNVENVVPEYDDEVSQLIEWVRPPSICEFPVYFNPSERRLAARQGSLPDQTFVGTLMAICAFSKYDLIENLFASRPEDFLQYGIYTCRFYVDGEWVEVITDTNLPCIKNNITGMFSPVYGTSLNTTEMWVAFVEKAFAKAMGSYEEIPSIKVQKALLHLTGGSVQQLNLRDEVNKLDSVSDIAAWNDFKDRVEKDSIVLMMPTEKKPTEDDAQSEQTPIDSGASGGGSAGGGGGSSRQPMLPGAAATHENFFLPDALYSVIMCRELDGYELVLMHNPWVDNKEYVWTGEWSDSSNDWDLYPELLVEIERDPAVPWKRREPNGYFWISFRQVVKHFQRCFYCKLFPNEKFNFYCVRGECRGRQSAGPLVTVRDNDTVLREACEAKQRALTKATAAVVVDGDASWFNNPQYRITCPPGQGTVRVYLSVVPLGTGDEGALEQAENVHIAVTCQPKLPTQQANVWDVSEFELIAQDQLGATRSKGQETSVWDLELSPKNYYHVVLNTMKRRLEGDFILRVFATKPITFEGIAPISQFSLSGEWRRIGDADSTGGALRITGSDGVAKDNPKWCQNPQFHLELADPYGKDEIYLKIVVRRTDTRSTARVLNAKGSGGGGSSSAAHEQKKLDATVGLVVTKADLLEDPASKAKKKKKEPKQNLMGEPLPTKVSTLRKARDVDVEEMMRKLEMETPKTILRKLTVDPSSYHLTSTFSSKTEACVYYPKLPRAWVPHGLLVVPCLSEKGVKGAFDLEVYCSERVYLNQLPETFSRTIAGDWAEGSSAGGSHLSPLTWKKNPKFTLKFHYPVNTEDPCRVRITLARHGANWRNMCKRDTVGCMIGLYIFIHQGGELRPFYESTFVPDAEFCTEENFTLPQLQSGEVYTIMPTTFGEGKAGSFVLSILSEYEFTISKDKN